MKCEEKFNIKVKVEEGTMKETFIISWGNQGPFYGRRDTGIFQHNRKVYSTE